MPFDEFTAKKQSQACGFYAEVMCILCTLKTTEDTCLLLCRNADTIIQHTKENIVRSIFFTYGHLNWPTVGTVLYRITEKIGNYLLYTSLVSIYRNVFLLCFEGEDMSVCS